MSSGAKPKRTAAKKPKKDKKSSGAKPKDKK